MRSPRANLTPGVALGLLQIFVGYGEIEEVHVMKDKLTGGGSARPLRRDGDVLYAKTHQRPRHVWFPFSRHHTLVHARLFSFPPIAPLTPTHSTLPHNHASTHATHAFLRLAASSWLKCLRGELRVVTL